MSVDLIIGAGVKVEVALTYGTAVTVTAVTNASPGVATAAAHGLAARTAGYLDNIIGMDQLSGQAGRADLGSASTFVLTDLDTTSSGTYVSGTFIPVLTWATLSQSTTYQLGGGAGKNEDVGTLIDTTEKLLTIKNAAETVTIDVRSLRTDNAAMAKIRTTARALGFAVFRVTHPLSTGQTIVGSQRLFRGQPSIPGESVSQGGTGTGQMSVTIKGQVLYLPGA